MLNWIGEALSFKEAYYTSLPLCFTSTSSTLQLLKKNLKHKKKTTTITVNKVFVLYQSPTL